MNGASIVGREYLRVSKDASSGRERSNTEQHDDNVDVCAAEGITLAADPYRDTARASRSSTAVRAGFDQLVADLTDDRFDADALVLWESSRGSRRVGEWCSLLDLLEDRGVRVFVTTHCRLYDPANPRDRRTLLEDAVDSEYESAKSSLRIRRNARATAMNGGRHGGRRAFGYHAVGGERHEVEAAIVRELVDRVLGGESVRSLAADLNRRGITTTAGNAWHPGPLRKMLAGSRIVGVRTHHGEVVARDAWPAIITEDQHRRVVATLAARTPVGRRGRTSWLLTGYLRCGKCGASLVGNTDAAGGTRRYVCRSGAGFNGCGSLGIKAEPLEALIADVAVERLADVDARRAAIGGPDDGGELAELDAIAARRVDLADDAARGTISRETRTADAAALDRYQAEVEARLAAKVRDLASLDLVAGYAGRRWADLDVEEQRKLVGALVEAVVVAPASVRGSNRFEPGRASIAWRI